MCEMEGFFHCNVPYFSQWASPEFNARIVNDGFDPCQDPNWQNSGFINPEEYRFWSRRICGLACLQSILAYTGRLPETAFELLQDALSFHVFEIEKSQVKGLIYDPFANWVERRFELGVTVFARISVESLVGKVRDNAMVIASVSTEIRNPTISNLRRGGHLVLVHGFDSRFIRFHNPSGVSPYMENATLSIEEFDGFFASRGMLVTF
ncbi:C39 family peptidase [Trinickia sp. EG282A]|uniref:C39 family peptidase n=1 Tax=Trinickia sp. EG282A TaxID=3237013 RepID=UPI0034D1CF9D